MIIINFIQKHNCLLKSLKNDAEFISLPMDTFNTKFD